MVGKVEMSMEETGSFLVSTLFVIWREDGYKTCSTGRQANPLALGLWLSSREQSLFLYKF